MLILLLTQSKHLSTRIMTREAKGQGLIEYALIILLIVLGILLVLGLIGGQVQTAFQTIVDAFASGE